MWGGDVTNSLLAQNRVYSRLYMWGDNADGQVGNLNSPPTYIKWDALASSGTHMMGIKADGTLWAWGNNTGGELGDLTKVSKSSPVQIGGGSTWQSIDVGMSQSVAIDTNGNLWAWGYNAQGQIGDGTTVDKSSPVLVARGGWKSVSCGVNGVIALRNDNRPYVWGFNGNNHLGLGDAVSRSSPVQLGSASWSQISFAARNRIGGIGIQLDGSMWTWGVQNFGEFGNNTSTGSLTTPAKIGTDSWTSVSAGGSHSVGVKSDGTLWAWGSNDYGQLGTGDGTTITYSSPVQVGNFSWKQVSAGGAGTAAIRSDNVLFTWGYNAFGQLGDGTTINRSTPVAFTMPSTALYVDFAGGLSSAVVLDTENEGYVAGYNATGSMGDGTTLNRSMPIHVGGTTNGKNTIVSDTTFVSDSWSQVASGTSHTVALKPDGTLWTWGDNRYGQLGLGVSSVMAYISSPTQVGTSSWYAVAAGPNTTYAIHQDNRLYGWGDNEYGQLAQISVDPQGQTSGLTPYVTGIDYWTSVSNGQNHVLAIKKDGSLWAWGRDEAGQLGNGKKYNYQSRSVPTLISTQSWNFIAAGYSNSMAVRSDGTAWVWGQINAGMLPQPYHTLTGTFSYPLQIGTDTNWAKFYIDGNMGMGIKTTGTLWSWGNAGMGTGQNQIAISYSSPVQVTSATNWKELSFQSTSTIALNNAGQLYFWGVNTYGLTGNNETINRSSPTQVGALSTWTKAYSSGSTAFGLKTDGTVWAWGWNGQGALGNNTTISRSSPVQVGATSSFSAVGQAAGTFFAIKTDGTLWGWGNNGNGQADASTSNVSRSSPVQLGSATNWSKIAQPGPFSASGTGLAISTTGDLWAWGDSMYGQTGFGGFGGNQFAIKTVYAAIYASPVLVNSLSSFTMVTAGLRQAAGIRKDGRLLVWGANEQGQLGFGDTIARNGVATPTSISTSSWTTVSAGNDYIIAVDKSFKLYGWGSDKSKYVAGMYATPTYSWTQASASTTNTALFLRADNTLWSVGLNTSGQQGQGDTFNRSSPTQIGAGTWSFIPVQSGQIGPQLAVNSTGTLYGWGYNTGGLGDGTTLNKSSPIQIGTLLTGLTSSNSIAIGASRGIATRGAAKNIVMWGAGNTAGQLLNGGTADALSATTNWAPYIKDISKVAQNITNYYAIRTDGKLFAWGDNTYGQLGLNNNNTTLYNQAVVQVMPGTSFTNVYAWDTRSVVALDTLGRLWTWGYATTSNSGLGVGWDMNHHISSPTQVGIGSSWTTITGNAFGSMLAKKTDGTYWAWGYNPGIYPGISPTSTFSQTFKLALGSNSLGTTYAINDMGSLFGWGDNTYYELKDGTIIARSSPIQIAAGPLNSYQSVTTAGDRTYVISGDGTLWAWGYNAFLNLGINAPSTTMSTPMIVTTTPSVSWASISAGLSHTLGITTTGDLYGWGSNLYGQLGLAPALSWTSVSVGARNTYFIRSDGIMFAAGLGTNGELGTRSVTVLASPVQIGTDSWTMVAGGSVSATAGFASAIKSDGTLWAWGTNTSGQLGTSDTINRSSPVQIGTSSWTSVFSGNSVTFGIKLDGTLWAWGNNTAGIFGTPTDFYQKSSPVQVGTDTDWKSVEVTNSASSTTDQLALGLKTDGSLYTWGQNLYGGMGAEGTTVSWSTLALAGSTAFGITTTGDFYRWGTGSTGVLMDGQFGTLSYPTLVSLPTTVGTLYPGTVISSFTDSTGKLWQWGGNHYNGIATGGTWAQIAPSGSYGSFAAAIKTDGRLYTWGTNLYGQLGNNTGSINVSFPTPLGTDKWSSISVALSHTVGVKADGTAWAWGGNTHGQLGQNDIISRSSPVQVGAGLLPAGTSWVKASAGGGAISTGGISAFLASNGSLWMIGDGTSGGLGNSTTASRSAPVQVGGTLTFTDMSLSLYLTHGALDDTGALYMWGDNTGGILGTSDTLARSYPVQVPLPKAATKFFVKSSMAAAQLSDSTLWAWGVNTANQLSIGDAISRSSPVQVGTSSWNMVMTTQQGAGFGGTWFAYPAGGGTLYQFGSSQTPTAVTTSLVYDSIVGAGSGSGATYYGLTSAKQPAIWGNSMSWSYGVPSLTLHADATINNPGINVLASTPDSSVNFSPWVMAPTLVSTSSWAMVSTEGGGYHTLAIKTDGTLWVWGHNATGQLGINSAGTAVSMMQVGTSSWTMVSQGSGWSAGIKQDGTLWTWGANGGGFLGLGDTINRSSPVQVSGGGSWSQVKASASGIVALKSDNTMWNWGVNTFGTLGQNDVIARSAPVQVQTGFTFTKIATASLTTYGLRSDGTLWGCGYNQGYNLGVSDALNRSAPVQIPGVTSPTDLYTAPGGSALLLKMGGTIYSLGTASTTTNPGGGTSPSLMTPVGINSLKYQFARPTKLGTSSWTAIGAGLGHAAAIKLDGSLWSWGKNTVGQLGFNDIISRSSPVQLGTSSWSAVAAGDSYTIATRTDSTVWAWGDNSTYALGSRYLTTVYSWSQVTSGWSHTLAIRSDGTLWSSGFNSSGQLGDNTNISKSSPVQVSALTTWSKVAVAANASFALRTDGTLWAWGGNVAGILGTNDGIPRSSPVQIGTAKTWSKIYTGVSSAMAVATDGTLWLWGYAFWGVLGTNDQINRSSPTQLGSLTTWSHGAMGFNAAAAVNTSGQLFTWGFNSYGALGSNTTISRSSPVQVTTPASSWSFIGGSKGVGAQDYFFGITTIGSLFAWGGEGSGHLGLGSNTISRSAPTQITGTNSWTFAASLAYNSNTTLFRTTTGAVFSAGWQPAVGSTGYVSTPVQVLTANAWSANMDPCGQALINSATNTLWIWNILNTYGAAGLGDTIGRSSPTQLGGQDITRFSSPVQVPGSGNFSILSAGTYQTAALKLTSGVNLYTWGINTYSGLGVGDAATRSSPTQVGNGTWTVFNLPTKVGTGYSSVNAGTSHTIAIKTDGTLWAWGLNNVGQLGLGTLISRSSPTQIGSATNWTQVVAGDSHIVALDNTGAVYTAGGNSTGQLGQGDTVNRSSLTLVSGYTATWIAARQATGMISGNTPYMWGINSAGELGLGDTLNRSAPVQIAGKTAISYIFVGSSYAGVAGTSTAANTLWTWGKNTVGQLGINDNISRSSPVQVAAPMAGATSRLYKPTQLSLTSTSYPTLSLGGTAIYNIASDSLLYALGSSLYGELGQTNVLAQGSFTLIGSRLDSTPSVPTVLSTGGNTYSFTQLSAGYRHAMAIDYQGKLYTWGSKIGNAPIDSNFSWISGSIYQNGGLFLIRSDKTLWGAGLNGNGQLGQGNTVNTYSFLTQIGGSWNMVSSASATVTGIKTDGSLWTWGQNSLGTLGTGDVAQRSSPVQVGTSSWTFISTGDSSSAAITKDGAVFVWGYNGTGALGLNDTINRSSPVQLSASATGPWKTVQVGTSMMVALNGLGQLYAWGANQFGQLGTNDVIPRSSPVAIGTAIWYKLRAGAGTTFGINANGNLYGWGTNTQGTIGDGTSVARSSPVLIGTTTNYWSDMFTNNGTTLAQRTDGTMWGWGNASFYAAAWVDPSTVARSSPVQLGSVFTGTVLKTPGSDPAASPFTNGKIIGTGRVSAILNTLGELATWGNSGSYEQGRGIVETKPAPTYVYSGIDPSTPVNTIAGTPSGLQNSYPVQISSTLSWTQISAGYDTTHGTATVGNDNVLFGWGYNDKAQLGMWTNNTIETSPIQIATGVTGSNMPVRGVGHTSPTSLMPWVNPQGGGVIKKF